MNRPIGHARNAAPLCLLLLALVFLASCAPKAKRPVEELTPLVATVQKDAGYRFKNLKDPDNSDELFVVLTFSGGGTRAAALSYGVLKKLHEQVVVVGEKRKPLLEEVDVISSVSGGSFTAAYYGLFRDRIFEDFEPLFLRRNIQAMIAREVFSPGNLLRTWFSHYSRSDVAAEYYNGHLFDGKTFRDLAALNRKPFLMINATDMNKGTQFTFIQNTFAPMCTDISGLRVATAVAASSAFPVLLSPITLPNHATSCDPSPPGWVHAALNPRSSDITSQRRQSALQWQSYRDPGRKFVHLIDGGVSDNLGLRPVLRNWESEIDELSLLTMINEGRIKRLAVIVVNAATDDSTNMDGKEKTPSVIPVLKAAATIPLGGVSFDSMNQLTALADRLQQDARAREDCNEALRNANPKAKLPGTLNTVSYYPILLSFQNVADEATRGRLMRMATSFSLSDDDVSLLIKTGGELLRDSSEFIRLLTDLQTP